MPSKISIKQLLQSGAALNDVISWNGSNWVAVAQTGGGAGITDGDKGDITVSGSGATWTIDDGAVSLAKMASVAANSFVGNDTGSPATPAALTGTQATALLDTFTTTLKGLVPAPATTSGLFLKDDGTWDSPTPYTYSSPSTVYVTNDTGAYATLGNVLIPSTTFRIDQITLMLNNATIGNVYTASILTIDSSGNITGTLATASTSFTTTATGFQQISLDLAVPATLNAGTYYLLAAIVTSGAGNTPCRLLVNTANTQQYSDLPINYGSMMAVFGSTNRRFWYVQNSVSPTSGAPASGSAGYYGIGVRAVLGSANIGGGGGGGGGGGSFNPSAISSDLIPAADNIYSLGSATNKWKDIFVSANTIYLGDATQLSGTSIVVDAGASPTSLSDMPTVQASKLIAAPFTYNPGAGPITVRPSIEFQVSGQSYPISLNTSTFEFSLDAQGNYGTGSLVAKKITLSNAAATALAITGNLTQTGDATFDGTVLFRGNTTLGEGSDTIAVNAGINPFTIAASNLSLDSSGNLVLQGNLTVSGTTTTINSNTLNIGDNTIVLNSDIGVSDTPTENAGIHIARGAEAAAQWLWNETTDAWTPMGGNIAGAGSITATSFVGALSGSATSLATPRTINGVAFDGTANITIADATKEPLIAAGTSAQYLRGDKSWQDLNLAVLGDVNIAGTPTDGYVLAYDAATSKWLPTEVAATGGGAGGGSGGGSGGSSGPVATKYWRIIYPIDVSVHGGLYCGFAEVEFQDSAGNNLSTGGTATASRQHDANWPPSEAFNGTKTSNGDGWLAGTVGNAPNQWIAYAHTTEVLPDRIAVWPVNDYATSFATRFYVQWSVDGLDWDTLGYFDTATPVAGTGQTFLFSAAQGGGSSGGASYPSLVSNAGKLLAVSDTETAVEWIDPSLVATGGMAVQALVLTNPGFETGDLTGWTATSMSVFTSRGSTTSALQGTYMAGPNAVALGSMYQDIDVSSFASEIDGDGIMYTGGFYGSQTYSSAEQIEHKVEFFDGSMNLVAPGSAFSVSSGSAGEWQKISITDIIPATTRTIRFHIRCPRLGGTNNDSAVDGAYAYLVGGSGSGGSLGGGAGATDGDKGDITVSGSGTTWTIDDGAVSLPKLANLSANSVIGNNTGSGASPIALSGTQVTALLDSFTTTTKGLVPAPATSSGKFLMDDGTWAAPATAWANPVTATGTGASQAITLPESGLAPADVMVFVDGVRWSVSEYTIAGSSLTLTTSASGDSIEIIKVSTIATAVAASEGTAFPSSPTTGKRFFRTDRGIEYYWDGARWLSTEIFVLALQGFDNLGGSYISSSQYEAARFVIPANPNGFYLESISATAKMTAGTTSSNYYTLQFYSVVDGSSTGSSVADLSFAGKTENVYNRVTAPLNTVLANDVVQIHGNIVETGTQFITFAAQARGRLVG